MITGYTATRNVGPNVPLFRAEIAGLADDTLVVTGGCIGGDALIARLARARGLEVHVVIPCNRSQVDPGWERYCTSYELMEPGTSYRQRNQRIVAISDQVVGIAGWEEQHPRSMRSGTWQTIRLARAAGKLAKVLVLHGVELATLEGGYAGE